MNYYKRLWNETTGEELTDYWGTSTYYFETDSNNVVIRQIQVFKNGKALKYSQQFLQDNYGGLTDQPLDVEDYEPFKIDKSEFERVWLLYVRN